MGNYCIDSYRITTFLTKREFDTLSIHEIYQALVLLNFCHLQNYQLTIKYNAIHMYNYKELTHFKCIIVGITICLAILSLVTTQGGTGRHIPDMRLTNMFCLRISMFIIYIQVILNNLASLVQYQGNHILQKLGFPCGSYQIVAI